MKWELSSISVLHFKSWRWRCGRCSFSWTILRAEVQIVSPGQLALYQLLWGTGFPLFRRLTKASALAQTSPSSSSYLCPSRGYGCDWVWGTVHQVALFSSLTLGKLAAPLKPVCAQLVFPQYLCECLCWGFRLILLLIKSDSFYESLQASLNSLFILKWCFLFRHCA